MASDVRWLGGKSAMQAMAIILDDWAIHAAKIEARRRIRRLEFPHIEPMLDKLPRVQEPAEDQGDRRAALN